MNIKNLRKNYDGLTMLERLALADNADARDDDSEIQAINAASPKEHFRQVDYYDLIQQIKLFRLCNLICRLSYIMQFDFYYLRAEMALTKKKSNLAEYEKHINNAKLSSFLYFRAKESWEMVNDDLGLRPDFDAEMSQFLFSLILMKAKEEVMRDVVFTEAEATEQVKKYFGDGKAKTVEEEANSIREALGLSKA